MRSVRDLDLRKAGAVVSFPLALDSFYRACHPGFGARQGGVVLVRGFEALSSEGEDGVADLVDAGGATGGGETRADLGEVGDLLAAGGGFGEQRFECGGQGIRVEASLEQFGDDAAAGDEIDHGDGQVAFAVGVGGDLGRVPDEGFGELEGERGDLVDDEEGIADECGLDGCGAGGDDRGAGVEEGFAGVGDEVDVGQGEGGVGAGVVGDPASDEVGEACAVDGGGDGEEVFHVARVAAGHLDHGGEVRFDLAPAAAGEQRDPGFAGVEVVMRGVEFSGDGGQG